MNSPRINHAHGINLAVARQLTAARIKQGWTIERLAAALPDTSLRSVTRYLNGEAAISIQVASDICTVIGVPLADVLEAAAKETPTETTKLNPEDRAEVDAAKSRIRRNRPAKPLVEQSRSGPGSAGAKRGGVG